MTFETNKKTTHTQKPNMNKLNRIQENKTKNSDVTDECQIYLHENVQNRFSFSPKISSITFGYFQSGLIVFEDNNGELFFLLLFRL